MIKKFICICLAFVAVISNGIYAENESIVTNHRLSKESNYCASKDFLGFLSNFSENIAAQKIFTENIIKRSYLDTTAEIEPKTIYVRQQKEKIEFPIFPNFDKRTIDGLDLKISKTNGNFFIVILEKPETDYQTIYTFIARNRYWYLTEINDNSL